uniref:Secreted protein n=1 Tax=Astatotilapia calliptera TaxID=8154 RepID=A0AAX7TFD2_ASTCA
MLLFVLLQVCKLCKLLVAGFTDVRAQRHDFGNGLGRVNGVKVFMGLNFFPGTKCILSCLRRLEDTTNDFKHSSHLKGLSPECTRRCLLRLERSANDLSHSVHINGFRPVWTSMWRRRSQEATKALSQLWHLYGSAGCRNLLEHLSQGNGFSPE